MMTDETGWFMVECAVEILSVKSVVHHIKKKPQLSPAAQVNQEDCLYIGLFLVQIFNQGKIKVNDLQFWP